MQTNGAAPRIKRDPDAPRIKQDPDARSISPTPEPPAPSAKNLLLRHIDTSIWKEIRNPDTNELTLLGKQLMADPAETKAKTASEEQVKFLVSCIRHSAEGKIAVKWEDVAQECGIVTKAAAQKRFERLMKSFGLRPNGDPIPGAGDSNSIPAPSTPAAKAPRKSKAKVKAENTDGEDATEAPAATPKKRKAAAKKDAGTPAKKVKKEPVEEAADDLSDAPEPEEAGAEMEED